MSLCLCWCNVKTADPMLYQMLQNIRAATLPETPWENAGHLPAGYLSFSAKYLDRTGYRINHNIPRPDPPQSVHPYNKNLPVKLFSPALILSRNSEGGSLKPFSSSSSPSFFSSFFPFSSFLIPSPSESQAVTDSGLKMRADPPSSSEG